MIGDPDVVLGFDTKAFWSEGWVMVCDLVVVCGLGCGLWTDV